MGKVIVQASMSLDGFIAGSNDEVGPLFDWYEPQRNLGDATFVRAMIMPQPIHLRSRRRSTY
jgi:hypothetical protein